jgi:hypothetical protein
MSEYVSNNMGHEIGWDDAIENDSTFTLLPEGDYSFTVTKFERARHNGSEKLPPCNKAVLTIELTDGKQKATIEHNIFLHSKCEGMLCEFFTAIGQRRHGEKLVPRWNQVIGATGTCKVGIRTWQNNRTGETRITGCGNTPIYLLTPERDGEPMRLLRLDAAIESYEGNHIDKVTQIAYENLIYARDRVNNRVNKK